MAGGRVGLQPQQLILLLAKPRLALGDLLVEPLHFHLLLGDDVHVLADLGDEVLDHSPGTVDLELDGHRLLDGVGDVAGRRAEIAVGVASHQNQAHQGRTAAKHQHFLNHGQYLLP